ncbi:MAG: class I SAM-dependent methyltransferase [Betaproteobacteria bacterium]
MSAETKGPSVQLLARERSLPGDSYWAGEHAEIMARYLYAGRLVAGRRVLDAATATGYGAQTLASLGAASVHGIDCNPGAIAEATRRCASPATTFAVDDCEQMRTVPGPIDVVCSFETIEHLKDPGAFLRGVARVLAPDGIFVCSTPERSSMPAFSNGRPQNPYHHFEWHKSEFHSLLSKHFQRIEMLSQVTTFSYAARWNAASGLANRRLIRMARRLPAWTGMRGLCAAIDALAVPNVYDFPVFEPDIAALLGEPLCNVAVCRSAIP